MSAQIELERGREAYASRSWAAAYESLSAAAHEPGDIELLATAAYMLGRQDDHAAALERAHLLHLEAGATLRAARCAFWIGMHLTLAGATGRASGWIARAQRLLDREGVECVEQGYLLLPQIFRHEARGDLDAAAATAGEAARAGQRFGDPDLFALAAQSQGDLLVRQGRVEDGLELLDEAMVAVTTGELSPIVSGLVYCGVILGCQAAYEIRRAQEWTEALTRWCEAQPDMVSFTGRCLVHRAELMQLHGAWAEALEEARRAGRRAAAAGNRLTAGEAYYREAELHRLQGELAAAERAYREANRCGWEPQPGLALLRLAEGDAGAAAAAVQRALDEAADRSRRAALLPAYVEIQLAVGDRSAAGAACDELEALAAGYDSRLLDAVVASARGVVALEAGDARSALPVLRRAWRLWQELEAAYEAARARVLVARACRALGDDETAALELEEARDAFARLGAAAELDRLAGSDGGHGLTAREVEVLRHVAAGRSNREIAAALTISEHTVARHLQNIFAKLGVSSRTAASAFAFERRLV